MERYCKILLICLVVVFVSPVFAQDASLQVKKYINSLKNCTPGTFIFANPLGPNYPRTTYIIKGIDSSNRCVVHHIVEIPRQTKKIEVVCKYTQQTLELMTNPEAARKLENVSIPESLEVMRAHSGSECEPVDD